MPFSSHKASHIRILLCQLKSEVWVRASLWGIIFYFWYSVRWLDYQIEVLYMFHTKIEVFGFILFLCLFSVSFQAPCNCRSLHINWQLSYQIERPSLTSTINGHPQLTFSPLESPPFILHNPPLPHLIPPPHLFCSLGPLSLSQFHLPWWMYLPSYPLWEFHPAHSYCKCEFCRLPSGNYRAWFNKNFYPKLLQAVGRSNIWIL